MGTDVLKIKDPLRPSLLNGAARLRREMKAHLGADLTVANDHNPFWHTGTSPNMNISTDVMRQRPWKHIWRVAAGVAMGKGSPSEAGEEKRKAEPYQRHIQRFLQQHMSGNAVD